MLHLLLGGQISRYALSRVYMPHGRIMEQRIIYCVLLTIDSKASSQINSWSFAVIAWTLQISCLIGDDVVPRILCSCAMLRWLSSRRLVCRSLCASVGLARWFPALEVAPLVGGRVPVEVPRTWPRPGNFCCYNWSLVIHVKKNQQSAWDLLHN